MNERMCFVAAWLEGEETKAALCRHFGISRKTGYKWLARYNEQGAMGLEDRSRAPLSNPRSVSQARIEAVLAIRHRHPSWGPRKVKAWLEANEPEVSWPAASTIGGLFDQAGLTRPRKRRQRAPVQMQPFAACRAPNDVWCVDFKGWFLTGDGIRVDPLTISDGHSRYLLCCQAVDRPDEAHVWPCFEAAFYDYGLPVAVRSDNGPPFAGRGAAGLSCLSVKLIKAGVKVDRIAPGKPHQNGRHERMHLTLKRETASPPAANLAQQIDRFDDFRRIYNDERPHEALGQIPPAQFYQPSPRRYDGRLRSPDYDQGVAVRRVRRCGVIKWRGREIFVSSALKGEPVGLHAIAEDTWLVKYGPVVLGTIKGEDTMQRIGTKRRRKTPKPQN
jgi:transposase InsO family protein